MKDRPFRIISLLLLLALLTPSSAVAQNVDEYDGYDEHPDEGYGPVSWGVGGFILSLLVGGGILTLLCLALTSWMIVDCVRTGRPGWIWLMVFLFPFGAIGYFLLERREANKALFDRIFGFAARREIRQLKAQIYHLDKPHLHAKLGEVYLRRGRNERAIESFSTALEREPDEIRTRAFLGYALQRAGRHGEAVEHLKQAVAKDPKFDYGQAQLALGRSLVEVDRGDEALEALTALLKGHAYAEARYLRGALLAERGDLDGARTEMEKIATDGAHLPKFARHRDAPWIRRAKRALRRM